VLTRTTTTYFLPIVNRLQKSLKMDNQDINKFMDYPIFEGLFDDCDFEIIDTNLPEEVDNFNSNALQLRNNGAGSSDLLAQAISNFGLQNRKMTMISGPTLPTASAIQSETIARAFSQRAASDDATSMITTSDELQHTNHAPVDTTTAIYSDLKFGHLNEENLPILNVSIIAESQISEKWPSSAIIKVLAMKEELLKDHGGLIKNDEAFVPTEAVKDLNTLNNAVMELFNVIGPHLFHVDDHNMVEVARTSYNEFLRTINAISSNSFLKKLITTERIGNLTRIPIIQEHAKEKFPLSITFNESESVPFYNYMLYVVRLICINNEISSLLEAIKDFYGTHRVAQLQDKAPNMLKHFMKASCTAHFLRASPRMNYTKRAFKRINFLTRCKVCLAALHKMLQNEQQGNSPAIATKYTNFISELRLPEKVVILLKFILIERDHGNAAKNIELLIHVLNLLNEFNLDLFEHSTNFSHDHHLFTIFAISIITFGKEAGTNFICGPDHSDSSVRLSNRAICNRVALDLVDQQHYNTPSLFTFFLTAVKCLRNDMVGANLQLFKDISYTLGYKLEDLQADILIMLSAYDAQHISPVSLLFMTEHLGQQDFKFLLAAIVMSNQDKQLIHSWDAALFEVLPFNEDNHLCVIDSSHSLSLAEQKSLWCLAPPSGTTYGRHVPPEASYTMFLISLNIMKDPIIPISLKTLDTRSLASRISLCIKAQEQLSRNMSLFCQLNQDGFYTINTQNVNNENLQACGFTPYNTLRAADQTLYKALSDYVSIMAPMAHEDIDTMSHSSTYVHEDHTEDNSDSKRQRLHNFEGHTNSEQDFNQTEEAESIDLSDIVVEDVDTLVASQTLSSSSPPAGSSIDYGENSSISSSSNDTSEEENDDPQALINYIQNRSESLPLEDTDTALATVSPNSSPNSDRSPKRQRVDDSNSDAPHDSTLLHPRGLLTSSRNEPLYGIVFPNNSSRMNDMAIVTAGIKLPNSAIFPVIAAILFPILSQLGVNNFRGTWNNREAARELIRLRGAVSMQAEIPYITVYRLDPQSPELTDFFSARLQANTLDTILLSEIPEQLVVMRVNEQQLDPHKTFLAYFIEVYLFKLLRKYYSQSRGPLRYIKERYILFQVLGEPLFPMNNKDARYIFQMADRDLHPSTRIFNGRGEQVNALQIGNYGGHPHLGTRQFIGTRLSVLLSVNPNPRESSNLSRTVEHLPNTMVAVLAHMRGPDINRAIIVIFPTRNGSMDAQILTNQVYILEQGHHFLTHDRSGFMFVTLTAYPTLVPEDMLLRDSQGFIICPPFMIDEEQPHNSAYEMYRSLFDNFRQNISRPFFNNLRNQEHLLLPFNRLDRQHLGPESWMLHVQRYINYLLDRGIYQLSRQLRFLRITNDHRILANIEIPRVTFNFSTLLNSVEILTCIAMATSSNPNDDDTSVENSIANNNIQAQYEIDVSQSPLSSQDSSFNNDDEN